MINVLARLKVGRLGTNAMVSTAGLVARAGLQAFYLLALTHALGAAGYGLFAGSIAVATIAASLSGWGIGQTLLEHVSRDRSRAGALWADALVQTALTGTVFAAIVVGALALSTDAIGVYMLVLLCVSELVAVPLSSAANLMLLAQEKPARAAVAAAAIPAARLVGLAWVLLDGAPTSFDRIVYVHFVGSLAGAAVSLAVVRLTGTRASWHLRMPHAQALRIGTRYALGALVIAAYGEIDKILALNLAGAESAGYYTAAFRVVVVLSLPVWGLLNAALPRLFAADTAAERRRVLRPLVAVALAYSIAAGAACAWGADSVVRLFGSQFAHSGASLTVLAAWLPLYALRLCGAFALTTSGRQSLRVQLELAGLALLIPCDMLLLPRLGGVGAAWSLLAIEALLAAVCWFAYLRRGAVRHP